MTDLAADLEAADPATADLRKLSDRVLLALGATRNFVGVAENPHYALWHLSGKYLKTPSPAESVDDGLALAGDDWEAVLDQALCRCSDSYESSGGAPLKALPLFICAALVRAAEAQK